MKDKKNKQGFSTKAIHSGQEPDPTTGAIVGPIYTSSTYVQDSPGEHKGYDYSRTINPTRRALEICIADLEEGGSGYAYASGMSAIATVLEILNSGDHVISMDDLYGGTYRLFENVRKRSAGLDFSFADISIVANLESSLQENSKMIWVESPSNPLLRIVDLKEVSKFAKDHGLITVCDNTFCSPYIQKPLTFGFDIVVHSATKYLNGHSDVIGGIVVCSEERGDLKEKLDFLSNSIGSIMSPFDSFLVLRSLKTLAVRMEKHCENASRVATFLQNHKAVEEVYYPGLSSHPQHDLAKNQMKQDMERRNDRTASVERREWGRLIRGDSHFTTTPRTDESIDAIKREDLLAFHKRFYHPDGFVFAVVENPATILLSCDLYLLLILCSISTYL